MARRRSPTADAHLRALRREAATVASELARSLQHAPAEIETVGPLVIEAFRDRNSQVLSEIDENQGRYEGREESWFCLVRQIRYHSEWGPRLIAALRSTDSEIPASPHGAQPP